MNQKEHMIESVILHNQEYRGKRLERVVNAMEIVDRKFFIPQSLKNSCYDNEALLIGYKQTISQPSTVAIMLLLANLKEGLSTLEVGAGSGWNACLIQYLVYPCKVLAIERISKLTENAKNNLSKLKKYLKKEKSGDLIRFKNLTIETDDALNEDSRVWKKRYDRIVITAGITFDTEIEKTIQRMADRLLKENGILICPQQNGPIKIYKKNKELKLGKTDGSYVFVPLLRGRK